MNIVITVTDNSAEVLAALENACQRALEAIGMRASGYAKDLSPADTGLLQGSMDYLVDGDTVNVGTNTEYAIYQEIGTGIHASEGGGRQGGWYYPKADGSFGFTLGSEAHHMVRNSMADHTDEYMTLIVESLTNA